MSLQLKAVKIVAAIHAGLVNRAISSTVKQRTTIDRNFDSQIAHANEYEAAGRAMLVEANKIRKEAMATLEAATLANTNNENILLNLHDDLADARLRLN